MKLQHQPLGPASGLGQGPEKWRFFAGFLLPWGEMSSWRDGTASQGLPGSVSCPVVQHLVLGASLLSWVLLSLGV